jgi:hypothetical protein
MRDGTLASQRCFDLVALGEAMLEFNQTQPSQPHYLQGYGGDTSNAVIAAARAGAHTAYLSRVGSDWFKDQLLALWASEGVDDQRLEQRGFAVSRISSQDLAEITKTRSWLEEIALRESIHAHTTQWEESLMLARHRLAGTNVCR